jgi:hypothetical protein
MLSKRSTSARFGIRRYCFLLALWGTLHATISGCEGTEIIADLYGKAEASDVNGGDSLSANPDEFSRESPEQDTGWSAQQSSHDCGVFVHEGDATPQNAYELEQLRNFSSIDGDLYIGGERNDDIWDLSALSNLLCVEGEIAIVDNDRLGSIWGLSHLRRIDGDITIIDNDSLSTRDVIYFIDLIQWDANAKRREWNGEPCVYGNLYGGWEDDWYQSGCDHR